MYPGTSFLVAKDSSANNESNVSQISSHTLILICGLSAVLGALIVAALMLGVRLWTRRRAGAVSRRRQIAAVISGSSDPDAISRASSELSLQ